METKRSSFSSKIGFVLVAAGSAVGLGNIWRFPYLAAKYGGGIFLFVYIILALTFGFTLAVGEVGIGRKSGLSAIGSFKKLNEKYAFIGYLASMVPIIILPYYSVIGGWVIKYFSVFLTGQAGMAAQDTYFGSFTAQTWEPILCLFLFVCATTFIVYRGVEKGLEKASKFLMPILAVLTVGIALYSVSLPGAWEGLIYYVKPDFSKFSFTMVVGAMGQLFYSMSLAVGVMITYGSYMKKDVDIEMSTKQVEFFDTAIAFFAGMMIIPAVFAFSGGDASAVNAGPGLMFMTLPKVFDLIPGGNILGAAFFLLVLFAALTSSISLMETVVSIFMDKLKWSRKKSILVVFVFAMIVALPSTLGFGVWADVRILGMDILTFFDFISNSVLMPIVALLTCMFIGYVIKPDAIVEEVKISSPFKREKLFRVVIKYVAPICIVLILVTSVLSGFGAFTI